ncbi:MAG: glycosyltransferase family 2 protein [Planctomycetaceae bacterium]|nr:glycosyltransferase family 2 protein [Planctomycetaceae bacterium]
MLITASVLLVLTVASALLQVIWAHRFLNLYRPVDSTDSYCPKVLVVLSLRGADPFLHNCLAALFRQDYPSHHIRIIVDSRADPAWKVVQEVIDETGATHVELRELETPLGTCGLRVNALLQATTDLDPSCEIVAWLDADTLPYPQWLRDMVRPFQNPKVGATSGIRWYVPAFSNLGTLVRTAWNVAGVIQMVSFRMAFGGSLAYRASLLRDTTLRRQWSRILWEDVHTCRTVEDRGLRLEFVGAATLATRERISLAGCMRFLSRQMLNVRLYHSAFRLIALHSILMVAVPAGAIALMVFAAMSEQPFAAALSLGVLLVHAAGMLYACLRCGYCVRRSIVARGEPPWEAPWAMTPAVFFTPVIYLISIGRAAISRAIEWRSIQYKVRGPYEIDLVSYHPYTPPAATDKAESI